MLAYATSVNDLYSGVTVDCFHSIAMYMPLQQQQSTTPHNNMLTHSIITYTLLHYDM
jgi:hypothetical protein